MRSDIELLEIAERSLKHADMPTNDFEVSSVLKSMYPDSIIGTGVGDFDASLPMELWGVADNNQDLILNKVNNIAFYSHSGYRAIQSSAMIHNLRDGVFHGSFLRNKAIIIVDRLINHSHIFNHTLLSKSIHANEITYISLKNSVNISGRYIREINVDGFGYVEPAQVKMNAAAARDIEAFAYDNFHESTWDIIRADIRCSEAVGGYSYNIPMFAIPKESHASLYGNTIVCFVDLLFGYGFPVLLFALIKDYCKQPEQINESPEVARMREVLSSLMLVHKNHSDKIADMTARLSNMQDQLRGLQNTIASTGRNWTDGMRELSDYKSNAFKHAIETAKDMLCLSDTLASIRPIERASIDQGVISLKTYPYSMKVETVDYSGGSCDCEDGCGTPGCCCDCDPETIERFVQIGPLNIEINTNIEFGNEDDRDIVITSDDLDDIVHPHISGSGYDQLNDLPDICWGNARNAVAEAWGRRDWETLVRLIIAWATKFNPVDAHNDAETLLKYLPNADSPSGWKIPLASNQIELENESELNPIPTAVEDVRIPF